MIKQREFEELLLDDRGGWFVSTFRKGDDERNIINLIENCQLAWRNEIIETREKRGNDWATPEGLAHQMFHLANITRMIDYSPDYIPSKNVSDALQEEFAWVKEETDKLDPQYIELPSGVVKGVYQWYDDNPKGRGLFWNQKKEFRNYLTAIYKKCSKPDPEVQECMWYMDLQHLDIKR